MRISDWSSDVCSSDLLNNTLTVAAGQAGSHAGRGWDGVTDACVEAVVKQGLPTVFILWGSHARKKAERVPGIGRGDHHLVLTSPHPSPLSAHSGFFGSRQIGRASCRERVCQYVSIWVVVVTLKNKNKT